MQCWLDILFSYWHLGTSHGKIFRSRPDLFSVFLHRTASPWVVEFYESSYSPTLQFSRLKTECPYLLEFRVEISQVRYKFYKTTLCKTTGLQLQIEESLLYCSRSGSLGNASRSVLHSLFFFSFDLKIWTIFIRSFEFCFWKSLFTLVLLNSSRPKMFSLQMLAFLLLGSIFIPYVITYFSTVYLHV